MRTSPAPLYFALPGNEPFAERLALGLRAELGAARIRRFPDAETYVRLETPPTGREVVLVATMHPPDSCLIPILLLAETARELGAVRVGLVAPYLAYLRQDRRFRAGEGVTSRYVARLLSTYVDWVATVDPHLHRLASLAEIYTVPVAAVHAAPALGRWVAAHVRNPIIVGPDAESAQWARAVAETAGAPVAVLEKVRRGDDAVAVALPRAIRWRDRTPVLVDDIISTARTMIETVRQLRETSATAPICLAVHAVFARGAYEALLEGGAARILTCNTIPHETNAIDIVPDLVGALAGVREAAPSV